MDTQSKSVSDALLQRIAAENERDEGITVRLNRRLLPVLERYRRREAMNGSRSRRQSLGEVAGELIAAADELLRQRAGEQNHGHDSELNAVSETV